MSVGPNQSPQPQVNMRKHGARAAFATLTALVAWFMLVRPLEQRVAVQQRALASAQREIEQFESATLAEGELPPAIRDMQERLDALYDWARASGDSGRLYESLRRLAAISRVRIERIEPTVARQITKGQFTASETTVDSSGYIVEVTGAYEAIAAFTDACATQIGASRVSSLRVSTSAPTPNGEAPILNASIETSHLRLTPPRREGGAATTQGARTPARKVR
ncbi:hypothetical protein PHYC_03515 [Phycisphaerales bacterium]|nr:hypothetical protein PHYC_03515 [Phycisphaerales bacterium]